MVKRNLFCVYSIGLQLQSLNQDKNGYEVWKDLENVTEKDDETYELYEFTRLEADIFEHRNPVN
ncbi:hypothetical protein PIROE2DRAFT_16659, partial [Piromyces sp. E2]